ncbi:MAG: hypothetical protein R8K47_04265, partial [Mariprofundaceae bacterium]
MGIGDLLTADFPSSRSGERIRSSAPAVPMPMVLTLDQIQSYEGNPRQTRNECRDELKASIRERGLDVLLHVTQRPGEEHYIIESGGNTRLSILKELWEETKDDRFYRIQVMFRPWKGELHVLTAHIVENELRSGMCFWDKAQAMLRVKSLLENESGENLSWSEFGRRLKELGLPQTHAQLARMRFLVEKLAVVLPESIRPQLGPHHVQLLQSGFAEIRKRLERDFPDAGTEDELSDVREILESSWPDVRGALEELTHQFAAELTVDDKGRVVQSEQQDDAERLDSASRPDHEDGDHADVGGENECAHANAESNLAAPASRRAGGSPPESDAPTNETVQLLQRALDGRARAFAFACNILSKNQVAPSDVGFGFDVIRADTTEEQLVGALGDPGAVADLSAVLRMEQGQLDQFLNLIRECWSLEQTLRRLREQGVVDADPVDV